MGVALAINCEGATDWTTPFPGKTRNGGGSRRLRDVAARLVAMGLCIGDGEPGEAFFCCFYSLRLQVMTASGMSGMSRRWDAEKLWIGD